MDLKIVSAIEAIVGKENVKTSEEERKCYSYDARTGRRHSRPYCLSLLCGGRVGHTEARQPAPLPRDPARSGLRPYRRFGAGERRRRPLFYADEPDLDIDAENLIAIVEPGVINFLLQQEVAKKGLFYPPDPASYKYSSIGGNVAECAGGPNSLKYGVTRDYVLGMEVVLPTGEILDLG